MIQIALASFLLACLAAPSSAQRIATRPIGVVRAGSPMTRIPARPAGMRPAVRISTARGLQATVKTLATTVAPQTNTAALDPKFFANAQFQAANPKAFVLQAQSVDFVLQALAKTRLDGDAFIAAVRADPALAESIKNFNTLPEAERLDVMRRVFQIEVSVLGIAPPELIIDENAKRAAYFDFDPARPGPGKVILNPTLLFKDPNPYAALLFLIHETRHSEQLQLAFLPRTADPGAIGEGFRQAFITQRAIFDNRTPVSFCDFLTLANEYEAFQFGNYAMDALTAGKADTSGMGTWASQYGPNGALKIDLTELARQVGPENVLNAFNELEKTQYESSRR